MPDVRNCKRCGKIYNYIGGAPVCQDCRKQDEEDFKRVKEYLYDHPRATIFEVSKELDVSVQKIKGYLKEGRLEIVGDEANMILECESCGKSLRTGRFCDECAKGITNDIKSTADQLNKTMSEEIAAKRSAGMKYLNKNDK